MRLFITLSLGLCLFAGAPGGALSQDEPPVSEPEQEPAAPAWTANVGLSYLATSGNADTESIGFDLAAVRRPMPWGIELGAQFNSSEEDGEKTAERYLVALRGTRALSERWQAFLGLSAEQDEFSGIDQRNIVEAGGGYSALQGPRHILNLDLALTWTDERRLPPGVDASALGALAGLLYELAISDSATFSQDLAYHGNFDDTDDWRADSLTALTVALNSRLAVRLSHEIRFRNQPIGDNDDTDTTTMASLVWSM